MDAALFAFACDEEEYGDEEEEDVADGVIQCINSRCKSSDVASANISDDCIFNFKKFVMSLAFE
jgi:hypothetical protein